MSLQQIARASLVCWLLLALPVVTWADLGWPGFVAVVVPPAVAAYGVVRWWPSYRDDRALAVADPKFSAVRRAVDRGEPPAERSLWPAVGALVEHRRARLAELRWTVLVDGTLGVMLAMAYLSVRLARDASVLPAVAVAGLVVAAVALAVLSVGRDEARLDRLEQAVAEPPGGPWAEPPGSYEWPPGTAEWPPDRAGGGEQDRW